MVNNITNHNGQQYHQPQWSTISLTTMVNNITNHNGQQYHQPQWSTISPTTMVNSITNHNGIVVGDIVDHCGW
jgi:hypothetical protein